MSDKGSGSRDGTDSAPQTDAAGDSVTETATQAPSSDYKVRGKKSATSGTGVLGHNTATSGPAHGVEGISQAAGDSTNYVYPAGVYGKSTGNDRTFGVRGDATSSGGTGIYGRVAPDSYERNFNDTYPTGITGLTTYSSADTGLNGSAGVEGVATATTGDNIGVLGITNSSNGYGMYSIGDVYTGGNHKVSGDHEVTGHQSVGNVGLSAHLSSNTGIDSGTFTTVPFDEVNADDFGWHDSSTGVYTVQEPGVYHVDFLIDWADNFSEGDQIRYNLEVNGSTARGVAADTDIATTTDPARGFSKTLFGLAAGDTIKVQVYHDNGSTMQIFGDSVNQETYLTIHKVG